MYDLKIIALMKGLGYDRFYPNATYLRSEIHYSIASFQNKETDPLIFNIGSTDGSVIKAWKHVYSKYFPNRAWPEEEVEFPKGLFINKDKFIVAVDRDNVGDVFAFTNANRFSRPVIRGIDERLDLGQLQFIVSNAGVLFSLYEYPSHKLIDDFETYGNVKNFTEPSNKIGVAVESKIIGPYGSPIELETVHILPNGSIFNQRKYIDFE
ncbi:hypothetical protein [Mucilaginibacter gilvus]|uniref:Uncharacterized protein n=1 Tax=Mucilaginibacter gilvus TaxID=2305909 RepID=A0A444MJ96_9SPHI|nr:hypothetical protein [Mucilaginibacter gilvus]RWY48156.1 hypothetical protein EPL05_21505 [Mucilaginibacter gilvus]